MTIKGYFSLFWMTETTDTEDTITTNKIEFDGDANTPDNKSGLISFRTTPKKTDTSNPAPFQEIARKPDTGFSGLRYILNVYFDEQIGQAKAIATLRDWSIVDNTIPQKFREGRIGLRNNYRPEFNLTPDNTAGFKIISFDIDQNIAFNSVVKGIIILEFSGDPLKLGAT